METLRIEEVNQAFSKLVDQPPEQLEGLPLPEILGFLQRDAQSAPKEDPGSREVEIRTSGGHTKVVLTNSISDHDEYGKTHLIAFLTDITDRKMSEQAVQSHRDMLATIFDTSPYIMMIVDHEVRAQLINRAGVALSGRKKEEILGFLAGEVFQCINSFDPAGCGKSPDCLNCPVRTKVMHTFETGEPIFEGEGLLNILSEGGQLTRDVLISTVLIRMENEQMVLVTISDITDRKRMEEKLRAQHEIQRTLLSAIPAYVYFKDRGSVYITGNQRFTELSGVQEDEIPGKTDYDFFSKDDADRFRKDDAEIMTNGQAKLNYEVKGTDPDGNPIWYSTSKAPFYDATGETVGLVGVCFDITEQKRIQELLLQSERFRAVADLAGGIAHNFNNLLQIVIGNLELALMYLEMGDHVGLRGSLEQVLESSRFGAETVRRLQSLAGIRCHSQVLQKGIFDFSAIVRQALEVSQPWWKTAPEKQGKRVSIDVRLQDGCFVQLEKNEAFDVVVNLIKNAAEALTRDGAICVKTRIEGNQVILTVRDTGVGISEQNLKRVFNPFFTTKANAGAGLGLASSRKVVEDWGGSILVDSSEGQGTTFTIVLPLTKEEPQPVRKETTSADGKPPTVLMIDDEESIVDTLKNAFTLYDYRVLTALSGPAALNIFKENPVDIVICDLGMPEMTGWQVGKRIKSLCRDRGVNKTPFILLTGWGGQKTEAKEIAESGVDLVLEKPLNIEKLLGAVRDVMEKSLPSDPSQ